VGKNMRKVFRVWDIQEKQMSNSFDFTQPIWFKWGELKITHILLPRFVTMSWTGLKDINGVEIFEGDIVKGIDGWEDNKGRDSNNYLPKIYSVKWEGSELVPMSQDGEYLHFKSYWWEVIGNVYESSDLLKVLK
jgi:uncharacterized phage protein (TIGR01671 family)